MGPGSYSSTGTCTCTHMHTDIQTAPSAGVPASNLCFQPNVGTLPTYPQTNLPKQHSPAVGKGTQERLCATASYPYLAFPNPCRCT